MEERRLLLALSVVYSACFSIYSTQDYHKGDTTNSGLDPPAHISEENALLACPQANLVGEHFLI